MERMYAALQGLREEDRHSKQGLARRFYQRPVMDAMAQFPGMTRPLPGSVVCDWKPAGVCRLCSYGKKSLALRLHTKL